MGLENIPSVFLPLPCRILHKDTTRKYEMNLPVSQSKGGHGGTVHLARDTLLEGQE